MPTVQETGMLDRVRQELSVAAASRLWLERLALGAILLLAGALRTLWLSQNDYGRTYYAAAVRSMLESWHNLFFNAFDPAGFVSLDKPPIALWLQVASAKLMGFRGVAMLLPQAIEGLIAVALVYHLVRRSFGPLSGLLAALFLALTPISVAIDRSNNTDSCLVMVLLLALWALTRALETDRAGALLLAMACVGLGFNVKMGAALVLVPTLALTYFIMAQPRPVLGRIATLGAGGIVLVVVSLSWAAIYDLVPAGSRPYVGSTQHNSMLELALVHNGMSRFTRPAELQSTPAVDEDQSPPKQSQEQATQRQHWDASATGPVRLLHQHQAAQFGWLLPLSVAALMLGIGRREEDALTSRQRASLLLWGGWLLSYGIVFSYAGGFSTRTTWWHWRRR
jgi:4-amino-4-deoxy-L-arabinose transferase-like glycosyltransferase